MSAKKKEEFNLLEVCKRIDLSLNEADKQGRNTQPKDIKINTKTYSVKDAISLVQKLKRDVK